MAAWKDLADFYNPSLPLPINGKVYTVRSPDAETGRIFQDVMNVITAVYNGEEVTEQQRASIDMSDTEEREYYSSILGPVYDEMMADNLPWLWIKHAALTTHFWMSVGEEVAAEFWTSVDPKELNPVKQPQDRKPGTRKARPGSEGGKKPRKIPATRTDTSTGEALSGTVV